MSETREAVLLRVFIGESDRYGGHPLYEAIVLRARELHIAGATVLRGPLGFGRSSHLHTSKILRLSFDLPIVIEIVDEQQNIERLLSELDRMISSGLVTFEKVRMRTIEQANRLASNVRG